MGISAGVFRRGTLVADAYQGIAAVRDKRGSGEGTGTASSESRVRRKAALGVGFGFEAFESRFTPEKQGK